MYADFCAKFSTELFISFELLKVNYEETSDFFHVIFHFTFTFSLFKF